MGEPTGRTGGEHNTIVPDHMNSGSCNTEGGEAKDPALASDTGFVICVYGLSSLVPNDQTLMGRHRNAIEGAPDTIQCICYTVKGMRMKQHVISERL